MVQKPRHRVAGVRVILWRDGDKVKRGVRFVNLNKYDKFIYEILKPVNFCNYKWQLGFHEIYKILDNNFSSESLFSEETINGEDFFEIIKNNTYYMIFLELSAYRISSEIADISTYDEFVKSECELIMLVADSSYTDVYCKDEDLIEKIYMNAKNNQYENIEYIDENDERERMSVW
jgi:hypothetical protein